MTQIPDLHGSPTADDIFDTVPGTPVDTGKDASVVEYKGQVYFIGLNKYGATKLFRYSPKSGQVAQFADLANQPKRSAFITQHAPFRVVRGELYIHLNWRPYVNGGTKLYPIPSSLISIPKGRCGLPLRSEARETPRA